MVDKKWYDNAVMVNRDPNWMHVLSGESREACIRGITEYFSLFEGSVTDVLLGMFEQTAAVPSKAVMWRGDKFLQKIENGREVSYPNLEPLYKAFAEYKVDAVQIFIEQMKRLGIRPWLTFRMNDGHFFDSETSFLHSDMFYEEKAAGHNVGVRYLGNQNLFNFRYERYKTALLGYIKELLDRYDVFGIELDFMRNIVCFDYIENPDGIQEIMLDYIRAVKACTAEAEKRLGHDVKISIRICRDPDDAYDFGFDIKAMVDEGLVDVVVPTPFTTSDSGLPIRAWRRLLGDKVAIMGGIEFQNFKGTSSTALQSKAYAAAYFAQGADGIYYNNHEYYTERNRESWRVNRDSCLVGRREFVLTNPDISAFTTRNVRMLPKSFHDGAAFPLEIGKVKKTDKVTLTIDFEGEIQPTARISATGEVEGKVVEPLLAKARERDVVLTEHTAIEYDMSGFETDSRINLALCGRGTVYYIKLVIDAD